VDFNYVTNYRSLFKHSSVNIDAALAALLIVIHFASFWKEAIVPMVPYTGVLFLVSADEISLRTDYF